VAVLKAAAYFPWSESSFPEADVNREQAMPVSKMVGAKVKRREDPRLICGLAHYVDDIHLPNTLHVAILRSPYAHARIKGIQTDAALGHRGIVAVITGNDIRDQVGQVPVASQNPTLRTPKHYVLAVEKCSRGYPFQQLPLYAS
jgi:xanthine dehydrogenase molybdopterin-binding subunit B